MIKLFARLSIAGAALVLSMPVSYAARPEQKVARNQNSGPHKTARSHLIARSHALSGLASFYRLPGPTSSGELFAMNGLTAAHRTLPFNTRVKVTCAKSGKSVVVRINDRGPFRKGRVIDVSYRAAQVLGIQSQGLTQVSLQVMR